MFSLLALLTLSVFSSTVSAAPVAARKELPRSINRGGHGGSSSFLTSHFAPPTCDLSKAKINFPSGQTNLTVPTAAPEFIMVGRGTQNYTCNSTSSTFASAGASATLFDVSCLASIMPSSTFFSIPQMAMKLPNPPQTSSGFTTSNSNPFIAHIAASNISVGHHYFVQEPTGSTPSGIQPKFDFTAAGSPADTTRYQTLSKTAALNAPSSPTTNVPWLQLAAISGQGSLASAVYRVDTVSGQPATSCTAGETSEVDYAALYYFYK